MPSERSQMLKAIIISFICHSEKVKTIEKEIRSIVDKGWDGREVDYKVHDVTFWDDDNTLYLD